MPVRNENSPQDSPALVVARYLLKLRERIAPSGSRRERLLRTIYVPIINRLKTKALEDAQGGAPVPTVVRWRGLTARGRSLPANPRILILKLDHIGDFIVALPALEHLRASWPTANITLICASWNRDWAQASGLFDTVIPFDFFTSTNAEWRGATAEQFAAFEALRPGSFDLAIDLRHDPDTRMLLGQIDATFRAGFYAPSHRGGDSLDIALPDMEHISMAAGTGRPVPAALRLQLLAYAVTASFMPPVTPAARLIGPAAPPGGDRRYAILAPGAGSPIRIWPLSRLIEAGRTIADRYDLDIVVTGSPAERDAGEAIVQALAGKNVKNLAGVLPLAELPALISGASLYIGYDTGTTHLAASLDVPTVAILSGVPTLEVWEPTGKKVIVVAGRIACSPCYLTQASQCPYGVPCLTVITTDDVLSACDVLLSRPSVAAHHPPNPGPDRPDQPVQKRVAQDKGP
jgi:ADP-heptose:LPS heptosyltransferase